MAVANKTTVQQNRIKALHNDRKSVGTKTKVLEHPRSSPPIATCSNRYVTIIMTAVIHYYYFYD